MKYGCMQRPLSVSYLTDKDLSCRILLGTVIGRCWVLFGLRRLLVVLCGLCDSWYASSMVFHDITLSTTNKIGTLGGADTTRRNFNTGLKYSGVI